MFTKNFVALAGNIGSGKTTAAKLLSRKLGYELFEEPVIDNRFLSPYYNNMCRWSFTLQLEFLIKRVSHHELIKTIEKNCIQDRTLIEDPEIFAKYLHGLGNMTDDELQLYFEYFHRLNKKIHQPKNIICFQCSDLAVLQARIKKRGRQEEQNIPLEFLAGLNSYYMAFPQSIKEKYKISVMNFDVTEFNIHDQKDANFFVSQVEQFISKSTNKLIN